MARSSLMLWFNAGVAVVLFLAVRGLLAMRTWGLLLGALASLGLLALAPFYGPTNAVTLTLAAVPALAFWVVPLLLARRKQERRAAAPASRTRIALAVHDEGPAGAERHDGGETEGESRGSQAVMPPTS